MSENSIEYTSFLRMYRDYCTEDDKFDELCGYLSKYRQYIKEITFFNSKVHSVQKLDVTEEFADAFRRRLPVLHELGIRAGVNVHPTVGFFEQGGELKYEGAPFSVGAGGEIRIGNLCPTAPETLEYVKQLYTIVARAKPDFIYIDDDMKFQFYSICFCDVCIAAFEERTKAFSKRGLEANAENNRRLLGDRTFQREWIYFNAKLCGELYSLIEKTVHAEIPDAELGMMLCCSPMLKSEIEYYAQCLKGSLPNIRLRPGGGLYSDERIGDIVAKSVSMAVQDLNLPPFVTKLEAEIENFPGQSTRKSRGFMELEILNYLASGCTGIAYNVFDRSAALAEHAFKWDMIKDITAYASEYIGFFGRSVPRGVNMLCGFTDADDVIRKREYLMDYSEQFMYLGIPFCFDTGGASAFVITSRLAGVLDDGTLKRAFTKGVFLTGGALEILNGRGYGEYTGFSIEAVYEKDTFERELPCVFNIPKAGGEPYSRDGMQAFAWPEYRKSYSISVTGKNSEYLTELRDYSGNFKGFSMGICENSFGGRVCVSGYYAMSFCDSMSRKYQLRRVFDYLSRGELCANIESNHRIILYYRENAEKQGLTLLNMSLDDAENVVIRIKGGKNDGLQIRYYSKGSIYDAPVNYLRADGAASLYELTLLPGLSSGYITL